MSRARGVPGARDRPACTRAKCSLTAEGRQRLIDRSVDDLNAPPRESDRPLKRLCHVPSDLCESRPLSHFGATATRSLMCSANPGRLARVCDGWWACAGPTSGKASFDASIKLAPPARPGVSATGLGSRSRWLRLGFDLDLG